MPQMSEVRIEKEFKPFPVLWHAARCLREIRDAETVPGRYWAGLGALVMLAFAVEGFCQTEGPGIFGDDWDNEDGARVERKPVLEKFKLIGKSVGASVNYGQLPWSDVKRVMRARDALAHPRPAKRDKSALLEIPEGVHPIDAAAHLVLEDWEPLLEPATARKLAESIDAALKDIWTRMGRDEWQLHFQGSTSYMMTVTK